MITVGSQEGVTSFCNQLQEWVENVGIGDVCKYFGSEEIAMPRSTYLPDDTLTGSNTELQSASLLHFWKWAFSDLCDDDIKGIFAEWLVLKLLGIPSVRRVSWANSDIITPDGVRIEIKSTSYWQSWKLLDEMGVLRPTALHPISPKTQIRFAGPEGT